MSNEVENNQASEPTQTEDAPLESLQDAPQDSTQDATKDSTQDATKDSTQDAPKDSTQDAPKDSTQDAAKDSTQDAPKDSTESKEVISKIVESAQSNNDTNNTVVTEELNKKIIRQIEYYFGNYNLPRDKFLSEQVKLEDGWVPLDTMVKFKRLKDLTTDHEVIRNALKKSGLMEIDDVGDKIRRLPKIPLPYSEDLKAETVKRSVYCKGLPKDGSVNLDILLEHFKEFGQFDTIHMRHFVDRQAKKSGFKGSIIIVFHTEEKAKEFMDLDDVKFGGMPLLRKWHKDYIAEKAVEIKERQARKQARLEMISRGCDENALYTDIDPIPRGSFIFASGFVGMTTREDIRAAFSSYAADIAFISLSKGDSSGYIRFSTPFCNKKVLEDMDGKLKVNNTIISLRLVEGEEEEEQVKLAEQARTKSMTQSNRKRKGFGGRGGRFNKRRRV